jgi:hypothetical protein
MTAIPRESRCKLTGMPTTLMPIRSRTGSPRSCTTGQPANRRRARRRPTVRTFSPSPAWSPASIQSTMRAAFATYAHDREAASIRRCWSTWNVLCAFLYNRRAVGRQPHATDSAGLNCPRACPRPSPVPPWRRCWRLSPRTVTPSAEPTGPNTISPSSSPRCWPVCPPKSSASPCG